jgi:predicted amidohydrolase
MTAPAQPTQITLAAVCMTSTNDKARNVDTALAYVREAKARGADWVQLPEMFPFFGTYDRVYEMAELQGGPLYTRLSDLAKELGIILVAGSVGERADRDELPDSVVLNANGHKRVFNTCYVFGRQGELLAKYRKTHLFNLYDESGKPKYCESDGFIPGDDVAALTIDGFRLGLSICYDLRFSELYDKIALAAPPDILAVPSAFTRGTGTYHWELLLRARAVERQCYVWAANQTGEHGPGKESFGHSMLIDPWGTTIANTGAHVGLAIATITRQAIAETRARLPALANRRPAIYQR